MNTQTSKIELIEMLLREQRESSLFAIKQILQSKAETITDINAIKKLLSKSEKQYQEGKGIDYDAILNESETKYFSK